MNKIRDEQDAVLETKDEHAPHVFPGGGKGPPAGCSGVSCYIGVWYLRAYKTILRKKGITAFEDLNRHVMRTILDNAEEVGLDLWKLMKLTAEGAPIPADWGDEDDDYFQQRMLDL